jgi:hypothetical protein
VKWDGKTYHIRISEIQDDEGIFSGIEDFDSFIRNTMDIHFTRLNCIEENTDRDRKSRLLDLGPLHDLQGDIVSRFHR